MQPDQPQMQGGNPQGMQAFVQRALQGGQGAPQAGSPTPGGVSQDRPQGETTSILKQVAGEVSRTELIEILISRLKDLIPKEKPQPTQ